MALSLIDRLLGRAEPAPPEAKAMTGPGAFAMTYHTPMASFSRDPHRLMAEAQALFRTNVWVHAVEDAIGTRLSSRPWHLEDDEGETVTDDADEQSRAALKLLRRPNEEMTWRRLLKITCRHVGLTGNAFWYLDQRNALIGTPLRILYINPARMTPATDAVGNVTGWVLDHPDNQAVNARTSNQSRQGVPLKVEEVIHFTLDDPDWGIWGIGVAEAAQRKIELDRLTDTHAGGVMASGGRLSGLVTPKVNAGAIQDDQWTQFVRDWRSITSDPDAAKRLQIAKMPLDFTQMTASPKDLQLTDVMHGNRDDIFAAWGVPLSARGAIVGRGLNSGETQKYEEAALYQGAVEPRGVQLVETIQIKLLDRFAAAGVPLTLVVDWPTFDDEAPLYENASKAKVIPLTVDQRLESVGKDPLDPAIYGDLGKAIFIDQTMVPLFDPTAAAPTPEPAAPPPAATDAEVEVLEGKADLSRPLLGLRQRTETTWEPRLRRAVARVLGEQHRLVGTKLEHALRKNDLTWWDDQRERKRFLDALNPLLSEMARDVAGETRRIARKPGAKADTWLDTVLDAIRASVGEHIAGINATTRDRLREVIAAGVAEGESVTDIADRLRPTFDESRAEMISRTETMNAYNEAALRSYDALEVTEVQAVDGDTDDECAARNGKVYPISEAMGIADHPNGTLDWVPVVP